MNHPQILASNLIKVSKLLGKFINSEEEQARWLLQPNEELANARPLELILSHNPKDAERVFDLIGDMK